jgi:nucleoside-diphosphate-sugar epimerase
MKVLVTGATGFVGSHLAESLVDAGYDVKALVRQDSDLSPLNHLEIEIAHGDIRDPFSVEKAVGGCERVYHLAAKTSPTKSSRKEYYAVNVGGTENVAGAAVKTGVERLVYCSSAGVYGSICSPPVDENTNPAPNSLYRTSKLLAEEVVRSYHKKGELSVVIARISGVIGPRSLSWLGLFQAISSGGFRIIGAGENYQHVGYVSDVVDGLRRCGEVHDVEGKTYLISGKEPVKLKDLVGLIVKELGIVRSSGRMPSGPFRAFNYLGEKFFERFGIELPYARRYDLFLKNEIFNISKAQTELGYDPKVPLREGIRQTIQWYREKGYIH